MTSEKELKKGITELKETLNILNVEKEEWFTKKESLKKEVSNLISQIKKIKFPKDSESAEVKKLKSKRDKCNKEVQKLIKQFKKLNSEKLKIMKDKKITFNPAEISKQIETLDYSIQTEALSFDKEKKIMIQIKHLKKQMANAGDAQGVFKELKEVSDKIKKAKDIAEEHHKKLQKEIKDNKPDYEEFRKLTKQINELKKKQEKAFANFIDSKNKFSEINSQLKGKLKNTKGMRTESDFKYKKENAKLLEEKTKEVEEKLKKKKKLTTEDLLIFQGSKK
ncbi:hypothetical protein HON86_02450 [Candidatus Woesearchaeota archaeon]|jgi:uncharacterized coiled-coil DUF342 family protein|nr:hypothetical protein [Candidatus Woesearchaeota archaeon]MBT4835457.1 hypothetical protein [Candidatus Woesearchaeota archaeon]MBT6734851.1 hypothetical protein [Candidatus Woesearchaeota archaeon]MBT7169634.1 hypothetical protein [Candidatus Woesearchaeota archaeon]MBT7474592.1 hypothetical protein [Candidatus Woesearchaeota archaeon]